MCVQGAHLPGKPGKPGKVGEDENWAQMSGKMHGGNSIIFQEAKEKSEKSYYKNLSNFLVLQYYIFFVYRTPVLFLVLLNWTIGVFLTWKILQGIPMYTI